MNQRTLLLLSSALILGMGPAPGSRLIPVDFRESAPIRVPADVRLEPGIEFTLELWVSVPEPLLEETTLLFVGSPASPAWGLAVAPDRRSIRILLEGKWVGGLPADLTDGKFHHLAYCRKALAAEWYVDHKTQMARDEGGLPIPFRAPRLNFPEALPGGRALTIGAASDDTPFEGQILSLRWWSRALSPEALKWTAKYYARPPADEERIEWNDEDFRPLVDHYLTAYALITDRAAPALKILPRPITVSEMKGITHLDAQAFILRNEQDELAWKDEAEGKESQRMRISSLYLQGGFPPDQEGANSLGALDLRAAYLNVPEGEPQFAVPAPVDFDPLDPVNSKRGVHPDRWVSCRFPPSGRIRGLVGVHDDTRLRALRFYLEDQEQPVDLNLSAFTVRANESVGMPSGQFFSLFIPDDAKFEGITGLRSAAGIHAVGLAWSPRTLSAEERRRMEFAKRRWVSMSGINEMERAPIRDDAAAFRYSTTNDTLRRIWDPRLGVPMHGNYTTQRVYRTLFQRWKGGDGKPAPLQLYGDDAILVPSLLLDSNTIQRVIHESVAGTDPLTAVPQTEEPGRDQIEWGGTFSLEHRPANLRANYVAYDIRFMDPRDCQSTVSAARPVFRTPGSNTAEYYATDNRVIVPHGLYFRADLRSTEQGESFTAKSAFEHQQAWSADIGFNAGGSFMGIGAAFSMDVSYAQERNTMASGKAAITVARTRAVRYALVMDKRRIELDESFRQAVLGLRDSLLVYGRIPSFQGIILGWGTHYPYAVTYGGMAFSETDYTETATSIMNKYSMSLAQKASVSLGNSSGADDCCAGSGGESLSAGEHSKVSSEDATTLTQEFSRQKDIFGTVGGSMTRGQGWSLSRGEEVPLLLDLRPISELLSPLFFDDPLIFQDLRIALARELEDMANRMAAEPGRLPSRTAVGFSAKVP